MKRRMTFYVSDTLREKLGMLKWLFGWPTLSAAVEACVDYTYISLHVDEIAEKWNEFVKIREDGGTG